MVVFWDPGSVPENWRPVSSEESLEAINDADGGTRVRYCQHCQNGKPPRCHHCSICKQTSFFHFLLLKVKLLLLLLVILRGQDGPYGTFGLPTYLVYTINLEV